MDAAVVILAGGQSRRMGRDKLTLAFHGQTMLESIIIRFRDVFGDVFLSVADESKYPDLDVRRVVDIMPGLGPLSGLHAALASLPCDGVFLLAADLPYASAPAAKRIIEICGDADACVMQLPDGRLEPLFGFYRKRLLPLCEEAIESGDYSMAEVINKADTRLVSPPELGELWDGRIILNINNPEDYERLLQMP